MIRTDWERESRKSVLASKFDDDDDGYTIGKSDIRLNCVWIIKIRYECLKPYNCVNCLHKDKLQELMIAYKWLISLVAYKKEKKTNNFMITRVYIYPTPPLRQDMTLGQFFSGV